MRSGLATIAPTAAVLESIPDASTLLTVDERGRAERLRRVGDRQDFVAAHVLLRLCAAHLFGRTPDLTIEQECPACGGPHGPAWLPELPAARVSMSRAGGVVAAAVAPRPVGVDVEPLASVSRMAGQAVRIAAPAERRELEALTDPAEALLMLWVRKEALVKLGRATLDRMADLDLSGLPLALPSGVEPRRLSWDRFSVVDLSLQAPAAVGAAVSESELEVVPLDRLHLRSP